MCPPTIPSSPPSANADTDSNHDSELPYTPSEPPYMPSELAAISLDFYPFLTTLHQLPYFDKYTEAYAHCKSRFIDHPSLRSPSSAFSKGNESEEEDEVEDEFLDSIGPIESGDGESVDPCDVVCLASGRASGGALSVLNYIRNGRLWLSTSK